MFLIMMAHYMVTHRDVVAIIEVSQRFIIPQIPFLKFIEKKHVDSLLQTGNKFD